MTVVNKTKNISIITAGFGETGNHELEDNIAKKCKEHGIRILGPNCLGHISTFNNLNASFADGFPSKGNVAFISQSGAYCSAMLDWAKEKEIGFSHFISIGNKADLSETDLLNAIKVIRIPKPLSSTLKHSRTDKSSLKYLGRLI